MSLKVTMRTLGVILAILVCSAVAQAQQVTITGTVKDANGTIYAGGSGVFTLVPQNVQWLVNQFNPVPSPVPIAQLDSFGNFSITLTNTSVIQPSTSNPQWQASFCSAQYSNPTTKYCFTLAPLTLTSSQDITATITPQAAILPTSGGGSGIVNPGTQYFIPLYPNGGSASVIGPSNIFTDSTKNNLTVPGKESVIGDALFASGLPWYDVTANGVICDGVDDQTTEVTALYNKIIAAGGGNISSSGIMYFPRTAHPCVFNGSAFSTAHTSGWVYVLQDTAWTLTGPVTPPSYTAFVCRSSTFQGLPSQFELYPSCSWQGIGATTQLLNITGNTHSYYFEGVNFEAGGAGGTTSVPLIDFECDGSGNAPSYINMEGITADSQSAFPIIKFNCTGPLNNGGYNLFVNHFSIGNVTSGGPTGQFTNSGQIYFTNGTFIGGGLNFTNNDGSTAGGLTAQNIEVEGLNNQDFLTINSGVGQIEQNFKLIQVQLADTSGSVYMVDSIGNDTQGIYIQGTDVGNAGSGMVDPASTTIFGFQCLGFGCAISSPIAGGQVFPYSKGDQPVVLEGGDASGNSGLYGGALNLVGALDLTSRTNASVTGSSNLIAGHVYPYGDSSNNSFSCVQGASATPCPLGSATHPWGTAFSQVVVAQGSVCTNAELALSAGWGNTATVTAVAGLGQTCQWTITSNGTGAAANPTITDTLTNPLPTAATVCEMRMVGGTGTATLINETTLSATAPIFTFGGTPGGSGATYFVIRRCGP